TPIATSTPPKPVTPPPPIAPLTPTKPVAAQPKKVELRLVSMPTGAKVLDSADGELLGVTPLVLSRPRGGSLTLRFEKDGYTASTRTMPLDADRAFEMTLEQKQKKHEHKPHEASSEPAKL
ncbi:MAG TPA: PEGA domain-containing protein, partial [Polyangia bacterium]|nr:PEGA domain-containing protein [Polyangia bacterium]